MKKTTCALNKTTQFPYGSSRTVPSQEVGLGYNLRKIGGLAVPSSGQWPWFLCISKRWDQEKPKRLSHILRSSTMGQSMGKSMGNPWEIHGESMEIHGKDGYKWRFIAVNFIV